MKPDTRERREASGLALPASVVVHVVLVLLLVFGLPLPQMQKPEEEEAIAVELVPRPEEEQQAQAEPPPPPPPPPAPEQPEPEQPEPEPEQPKPEPPPSEQAAEQPPPPAVLQPVFRFGEQEDGERVTAGDAAEEATPAEQEEAQQAEPQKPEAPVQPETLSAEQAEQLAAQSEQQDQPPTPTPKPELEEAPQQQPPAAEDAGRLASRADNGVTIATTAMNDLPRGVRAGRLCVTALRERMLNSVPPYYPDLLPSFRLDEGTVLNAPRAAFRMGGEWFGLSYRCEIDKDATRVRSFAFEVSGRLSQAERQRRGLPVR